MQNPPAEMVVAERDFRNYREIFPYGKVKYFLWKCEVLLTQCEVRLRRVMKALWDISKNKTPIRQNWGFTISFSKKVLHRRSLFHTPKGVFHGFAMQSGFTGCWAYPYAQHPKWLGDFVMLEDQRTYSMTTRRLGSVPVEWVVMLSISWRAAWIT